MNVIFLDFDGVLDTIHYNSEEEEGLLLRHKDEVGEILKKPNEVKKFALRKQRIKG